MPKLATGIDLIELERFQGALERHGDHFLNRIFTARELAETGENIASLAVRFSAKEAVTKALGTGIGEITWHEIEILRQPGGAPVLHLHGRANSLATEQGLLTWSISLSHTITHAIAVVVALGE